MRVSVFFGTLCILFKKYLKKNTNTLLWRIVIFFTLLYLLVKLEVRSLFGKKKNMKKRFV